VIIIQDSGVKLDFIKPSRGKKIFQLNLLSWKTQRTLAKKTFGQIHLVDLPEKCPNWRPELHPR